MTFSSDKPRRIAIIKPCCIGDCIMALPAVDAVFAANELATIDVFVGEHSRVAFQFRQGLTTRRVPNELDLSSAVQLSRVLRQGHYDTIVCLDRSRWLRLATRLSRATTTGHARSEVPEFRHESDVYLDVVREIGIQTPYSIPWVTPTPSGERQSAEFLSGIKSPIAVLHPGGAQNPGATMLDKRWPAERFAELARELKRMGTTVLLSGGTSDLPVIGYVAEHAGLDDRSKLAGKMDIETLAGIINRADVFVGPDTGITHIAAALGTPTIAIFGPTNPRRYRPLGRHVQVLAPPASWNIPDRDLRREPRLALSASTASISLEQVADATREALSLVHGMAPCDA